MVVLLLIEDHFTGQRPGGDLDECIIAFELVKSKYYL
jgi:hypothetical protein